MCVVSTCSPVERTVGHHYFRVNENFRLCESSIRVVAIMSFGYGTTADAKHRWAPRAGRQHQGCAASGGIKNRIGGGREGRRDALGAFAVGERQGRAPTRWT